MREYLLGQCASGLVFTTPKCASGLVFTTPECASASLVNVRVLVWSMCEWSGFYNIAMCEC